ncbi:MAG: hypothetical protein M3680_30270 [Myxococcota bacterium]|nr:hypothetical protein [Myxococcota bacterium]
MRASSTAAALAALTVLGSPLLATAGPVTAGISVGSLQSKVDAEGDGDGTLGLFGRLRFGRRISGQLEVTKIESDPELDYNRTVVRTATALLVVDLLERGTLMPVLFAGLGIDHASNDYQTTEGTHIEGGLGLEYRATNGLTLGLDVRLGGRSVEAPEYGYLADDALTACCSDDLRWAPPAALHEGEYRSVRLSLGITF